MLLSILYIIGITAEGMTGALAAGREKMDIFGVIIIASVTAIGGGSVRDVLLGQYPPGWVKHPEYFFFFFSAAVITVYVAPFINYFMRYFRTIFLVLVSFVLVVYSIIGAQIAMDMGHSLTIVCIAGCITGAFGGVLRDMLCNRIPLVFQKELYASIALFATLTYYALSTLQVEHTLAVLLTLINSFTLRLLAIHFEWGLPVFNYQELTSEEQDKLPNKKK